jgi:6-phosphofructokinase
MKPRQGKLLVAQGGGPTAVINQSLAGVVTEAAMFGAVERVYGALHGVRGIIDEEFIDLSQVTAANLEQVSETPSSALGSTRDKPDAKYCEEILKVLKAHNIAYFLYIGGNDTSETLRLISDKAREADFPLRCIHVPKTIDNDLVLNDHTPGFPSAARFIGQAFLGLNLDNRSLPGVHIGVVMGRSAGFLAAASSLGRKLPDDGPHLIYMPERIFKVDRFLGEIKQTVDRFGRCLVAVSEGVHDETGEPIVSKLIKTMEHDDYGNAQLSGNGALADVLCSQVKESLAIKHVRGDTLGYLQRSFAGCVSEIDQREARAVGVKAVQFAMNGNVDGSVTIARISNYAVDYRLVPLAAIAGKTRTMPDSFIADNDRDVTGEFHDYLLPLIGAAMPQTQRLNYVRVPKILRGTAEIA